MDVLIPKVKSNKIMWFSAIRREKTRNNEKPFMKKREKKEKKGTK